MGRRVGIDYEKFGLEYVAGRKVAHLHAKTRNKTQCGLFRLGLTVRNRNGAPVCRRCLRTVKVIKALGTKLAIFKTVDGEVAGVCKKR